MRVASDRATPPTPAITNKECPHCGGGPVMCDGYYEPECITCGWTDYTQSVPMRPTRQVLRIVRTWMPGGVVREATLDE